MLWEKKHCYKKLGSDIYCKSNYATFFITSPRFLCFSEELAQFIVTTGCFISRKISLKVVNHLLLSFDNPWIAKTLTGQTWLIDIYAMFPQNVSFLECFWRSHVKDVTQKTSFLKCFWDVLKTSQKRHLFWDVSERSLRYLSQWRSDWDLSETSHAG